jgi:diphosphomevalonate decarboxylase
MLHYDKVVTAEGSPNIAFIKYWGKRDERLILPHNSSISMTFDHNVLRTVTSVVFSKKLKKDIFYLDGKIMDLEHKEIKERFRIIDVLRKIAGTQACIMVVSKNFFPTASGLASSASGIATLVFAASKALGLSLTAKQLSVIARQGSGSACRSLFGGIVVWKKGSRPDGRDSFAEQVFDENYWPQLVDYIVVVSKSSKKVSSRAGMKQTIATNPLFKERPQSAEKRLRLLIKAYRERDISRLSELIMADSNEMHALMLSTIPSIRYLSPASYEIMDIVERLNEKNGRTIAGYTFDAGANANIITVEKHGKDIMKALGPLKKKGLVEYIKRSGVGTGPRLLDKSKSLIDASTLKPK